MASIWLTYHDVYALEPQSCAPQTAAMYHVSEQNFRQQLRVIQQSAHRVITASEYTEARAENTVAITFDDGWSGAFQIALPLLQQAGLKATFFITRDFVCCDGCCVEDDIVRAAKAGMEIGIHGTTHRMLSACSPTELEWELSSCIEFLEHLVGQKIRSASVPGGDVTAGVASCAKALGLTLLCTSQIGINRPNTSLFNINRVTIRQSTSALDVQRYCQYNINKEILRWAVFQIPRSVLGMKNYSRLRRRLLDRPEDAHLFEP